MWFCTSWASVDTMGCVVVLTSLSFFSSATGSNFPNSANTSVVLTDGLSAISRVVRGSRSVRNRMGEHVNSNERPVRTHSTAPFLHVCCQAMDVSHAMGAGVRRLIVETWGGEPPGLVINPGQDVSNFKGGQKKTSCCVGGQPKKKTAYIAHATLYTAIYYIFCICLQYMNIILHIPTITLILNQWWSCSDSKDCLWCVAVFLTSTCQWIDKSETSFWKHPKNTGLPLNAIHPDFKTNINQRKNYFRWLLLFSVHYQNPCIWFCLNI